MATEEKNQDGEKQKAEFRIERLNVEMKHHHNVPVKVEGGGYGWHHTIRIEAALDEAEVADVFADMQVTNGEKILGAICEEVPEIALGGCVYEDHRVSFWVSTKKIAEMKVCRIEGVKLIHRTGSNKPFSLSFKLKGVPDEDNDTALRLAYLDAQNGDLHALTVHGSEENTGQPSLHGIDGGKA